METQGTAEKQDPAPISLKNPTSKRKLGCKVVSVLLGVIVLIAGGFIWYLFSVFGSCGWSGSAYAWIDSNADGVFQEGEQPLPGVEFSVFDNGGRALIGGGISDWSGLAELNTSPHSCGSGRQLEVAANVPSGYRMTTIETQKVKNLSSKERIEFGFTYLAGVPTATPPISQPFCKVYQEFGFSSINSITQDADENIWVAAEEKVGWLNKADETWSFIESGTSYEGEAKFLAVSPEGVLWLISQEVNLNAIKPSKIYNWNGERWEEFIADVLERKEVQAVRFDPDGSIWFPTWGSGTYHWDPATNAWSSEGPVDSFDVFFASDGTHHIAEWRVPSGAVAPDGKVWFNFGTYYDPASKTIVEISSATVANEDMEFDSYGGMWLGTLDAGLIYIGDPLEGDSASWLVYHENIGFPSNYIKDLFLEKDNIIWVGTLSGLARCQIETR